MIFNTFVFAISSSICPQSLILIQKIFIKSLKLNIFFVIHLSSKPNLNSHKAIYSLHIYTSLSVNIHTYFSGVINISDLRSQKHNMLYTCTLLYIKNPKFFFIFKIYLAPNIVNKRSQICSQFIVTKINSTCFNAWDIWNKSISKTSFLKITWNWNNFQYHF